MILAALILAAAIPCADRTACPSRAEVERALAEQEYDHVSELNEDANPPGSAGIMLIPLQRIRISGIRCGPARGHPARRDL